VAKDTKKKTKAKKDKKGGKTATTAKAPKKAAKNLKALTQNPLVADVVAATLVAMASALKDSDKARRLANEAGDELNALAKKGAKQGNAMWDLALDVGRRTLETLAGEDSPRGKGTRPR
jgi:phosphoribosyl-dephospho-CoA transferase